jgi:hypothetical protein
MSDPGFGTDIGLDGLAARSARWLNPLAMKDQAWQLHHQSSANGEIGSQS